MFMYLALTAIILAIFALTCYAIVIFNNLVAVENNVDKAWSNIAVILKQRQDLIPKLIEVTKAYMNYEKSALEQIIDKRNSCINASGPKESSVAENQLSQSLKSLFSLAENYPNLKADESFTILSQQIAAIENKIAERREYYNDFVNTHNTVIKQIPDVCIARLRSMKQKDLFTMNIQDSDVKLDL